MQVNPKAGLTFASALRSILRADPDIMLIGEIRDRETAMIAIEAALTGHLVLSSLHTNDAASRHHAARRDGGRAVPGGLARSTASSPSGSRASCARSARSAYVPEHAELVEAGLPDVADRRDRPSCSVPTGCYGCSNTGYRGRVGLYEVMPDDRGDRAAHRRAGLLR